MGGGSVERDISGMGRIGQDRMVQMVYEEGGGCGKQTKQTKRRSNPSNMQ